MKPNLSTRDEVHCQELIENSIYKNKSGYRVVTAKSAQMWFCKAIV
jgi:hypothetical protein